MEIPNWFVCVLGMGIVFIGLIVLVLICWLMGVFCKNTGTADKTAAAVSATASAASSDAIPNKQELIAAISAALAEELGEDVSAIRITSIKKI